MMRNVGAKRRAKSASFLDVRLSDGLGRSIDVPKGAHHEPEK